MSTYRGRPATQINQSMKILFPETNGCSYADYPMTGNEWLTGKDKAPEGGYCFLRTEAQMPKDTGFKQGYVWGTGPFGYGYYHLLTKAAHVTLYQRIQNRKVYTGEPVVADASCCCLGPPPHVGKVIRLPHIPADDLDDIRRLYHARSVASKANDVDASADQLKDATITAQAHCTYNQNVQLGFGIDNAMVRS